MAKVEMIIDSMRQELLYYQWVVILRDKLGERYLPIYVSSPQGEIIRSLLVGTEPAKPVDFDFSVTSFDPNKADLTLVIINQFKKNVFHAKLLFTHHNKSYKADCPPAKAITLAIESEVPIFVEEAILRKATTEIQASNISR